MSATQTGCSTDTAPTTRRRRLPSANDRTRPSVLLAYFSRAGENYYYGDRTDLEVGNTEVLARLISQQLRAQGVHCVVHRIDASDPYPDD